MVDARTKAASFSHVCNKCFKKGHNALNCKRTAAVHRTRPVADNWGNHCMRRPPLLGQQFVLYLFSGKPRKNSIDACLQRLAKRMSIRARWDMVDILVKPFLDITKQSVRLDLLNKVRSGKYFAVLLSPPCSTFSRAWSRGVSNG